MAILRLDFGAIAMIVLNSNVDCATSALYAQSDLQRGARERQNPSRLRSAAFWRFLSPAV